MDGNRDGVPCNIAPYENASTGRQPAMRSRHRPVARRPRVARRHHGASAFRSRNAALIPHGSRWCVDARQRLHRRCKRTRCIGNLSPERCSIFPTREKWQRFGTTAEGFHCVSARRHPSHPPLTIGATPAAADSSRTSRCDFSESPGRRKSSHFRPAPRSPSPTRRTCPARPRRRPH